MLLRRIGGALTAGAVMLAAVPAALAAGPAAPRSAVTTHSVKSVGFAARAAVLAYWTPQRRASAIPAGIISVKAPVQTTRLKSFAAGKPGKVAGGPSVSRARSSLAAWPANELGKGGTVAYPYAFDSFDVPTSSYAINPYEVNGKIFFTNNGKDYVCSGTSVGSYRGSSKEDEVWTAGHCVSNSDLKSPGVFDSYAEFIPAHNGTEATNAPYGAFVATRYSVASNFVNNGDISVDEGAIEVGTNSGGQTLGQAVGWDGFAWNYPSSEDFLAFGYPAASPYTGELMVEDIASTASSVSWSGGEGQPLIGIGNPMTGGSSGGAWDIGWGNGGSGYINGHNDYKFYSEPNAMYSPYQDSLSNTVRCFGASSC